MIEASSLNDWLDRHHVNVVRTFATTLDGPAIGKYIHREKFTKCLPTGHTIADMSLFMDLSGMPHLTFWHRDRSAVFGDIYLRPDLHTLISDGTDPDLGHVICDFANEAGEALEICPRSTLKRMIDELTRLGYTMKAVCELEFYLYDESYADLRRKKYRNAKPVGASRSQNIYQLRSAYHATTFMNEVTRRLDWKQIAWEGWNDEGGVGQLELNLVPCDPVTAADNVVRTKQILYEVAVDLDMAVTFMARPGDGYGSGMHIHHSLLEGDEPAFFDPGAADNRSTLMNHWVGGLIETLPGAVSYLCPTVNAYRRIQDFSAVPVAANWGEENKSTALRLISRTAGASRVEYRIGSSDLNPYLALAVIIAGGIAGVRHRIEPPPEFTRLAWGLPDTIARLPDSISKAAHALARDELLVEMLGRDVIEYWAKSRENEWLAFHTEGGDPDSKSVTDWEFERYFELI